MQQSASMSQDLILLQAHDKNLKKTKSSEHP